MCSTYWVSSWGSLVTLKAYSKLFATHVEKKVAGGRTRLASIGSGRRSCSSIPVAMTEKMSYGSWKSPFSAALVSGSEKRLLGMAVDARGSLIWLEGRPTESGRAVLVKEGSEPGTVGADITPTHFNVRTTVHEYGGGAFFVDSDAVIFSNYGDQRLYMQSLKEVTAPTPVTPNYNGKCVRYADGVVDKKRNRYITVREDHRVNDKEPANEIVAVHLGVNQIQEPMVLLGGNEFYAFPRLSPDGSKLAWIEWSHPHMPWDRAELWVGDVSSEGRIVNKQCLAGGNPNMREAPTEPVWSSKGELYFVSDRDTGFWNLYRWAKEMGVLPLLSTDAEFSRPAWVFGNSSYCIVEESNSKYQGCVICSYRRRGKSHVGILYPGSVHISEILLPFTDVFDLILWKEMLFLQVASPTQPLAIIKVDLREITNENNIKSTMVWCSNSTDLNVYGCYISIPEIIEFPTKVPGQTAFAIFYQPFNPDYKPKDGEKPPLLVRSHGGPTGEAKQTLNLNVQYFTSRGWAFVDVNYGGSTGYGREYRERLNGTWGVVDVDDCCSCAEFLVDSGKVDGERLCIDGRSAGGYTTLAALVFRNTFKAGASLYGIGDLSLLLNDTHKFESHYVESLVGKDSEKIYKRSPVHFLENLSSPVILFQGLEDKVVPAEEATKIYAAVKEKGVPVALVMFEGEQHGFRKAENIEYTLEQEMVFFARVIGGFKVADNIHPVHVDNLD